MIVFSIAGIAFRLICAMVLFFWGENLFWKGLGVYLVGNTLLWAWCRPRLANVRAALHLSSIRAVGVGAALYILAAVLMAVGAATSLHPIFAAVVIIGCLVWLIFATQLLRSIARIA